MVEKEDYISVSLIFSIEASGPDGPRGRRIRDLLPLALAP